MADRLPPVPPPPARANRFWPAVGVMIAVDVIAFVITFHAHETYHATEPGQPSIMNLSQLLGWLVSVGVLVILILTLIGGYRSAQRRRNGGWVDVERRASPPR